MTDILATEKEYLRANHKALAAQYPGQFVVVKGAAVHGAFPTYEQGVTEAAKMFGVGPCLVRSVHHPEDPPPVYIPTLALGIPMSSRSAPAHA